MSRPRKTADQWFAEYGENHQDDVNELIHWICVPLIFFCVVGLIYAVPVPAALPAWFTWDLPVGLAVLGFYLRLSPSLAAGMLLFMGACHGLLQWQAAACPVPVWKTSLVLFVAAWIGQFIGHKIEGKKPSFFQDIVFLLIGPAWLLHFIYRRLGVRY